MKLRTKKDRRDYLLRDPRQLWNDAPYKSAWRVSRTKGGSPALARQFTYDPRPSGRCRKRDQAIVVVFITMGDVADHVRPKGWGTAKYYVDLEISAGKGCDWRAPYGNRPGRLVGHLERGFKTIEKAQEMFLWLKSCINETGVAGMKALNDRSGGRFA